MAITLETLTQNLDRRNWKYHVDLDRSSVITGIKAENVDDFMIHFRLSEDGEFLQLIAPQLLHVKDHVYKGVLFQTMLSISYEVKMLRFEYDPIDGEVRASIEIPLEDATFTPRQFDRCLSGLIHLVDERVMPRLKAVMATGEDPGAKDLATQLVDAMPPEMLNMLGQMAELIRQRQQN